MNTSSEQNPQTPPAAFSDDAATFEFDPDSAYLGSAHRGAIVALARRVLVEQVEGISISGPCGESASLRDRALGLERARAVASALRQSLQRLSPGSERRVDIALTSHTVGASEKAREQALVASVRFRQAPPVLARVFRVTAKSFAERRDDAVPESGQFVIVPLGNDACRLFSRAEIRAHHRGTRLLSLSVARCVSAGPHAAPSICLPERPGRALDAPFFSTRVDGSRVRFGWDMKGAHSERTRAPAWHRVEGIVDCSSGAPLVTLLTVAGSAASSHRAWVDGNLRHDIEPRSSTAEQGTRSVRARVA